MFNLGSSEKAELCSMTTPQIVALYNNLAAAAANAARSGEVAVQGKPFAPVKKFETRAVAIARTQKLLDAQTRAEAESAAAAEAVRKAERDAEAQRIEAASRESLKRGLQPKADAAAIAPSAKPARASKDIGVPAANPAGFGEVGGPAPKQSATAKPAKIAKVSEFGLSGTKLALLNMMRRPDGVSEAEGCEALGWAKCTATILKVAAHVAPQGLAMHRWRGDAGKTRYRLVAA